MISQISRMVSSNTPCVRRIRDHQRGKIILVRLGFGRRSATSMLPFASHATATTFIPAMTALAGFVPCAEVGNQTDIAMRFAARFVIRADDEQPGVFALRTGIGLQRNAREAGDFREPVFQLLKKNLIAARLLQRRERMNLRELRPRNGKHFRRGVELHRAGAERNHRGREREVARFEPLDVAEHFGLGVVAS